MEPGTLTYVGLLVVALAWLFQLSAVAGGSNRVQAPFVAIYATGAAFVVTDELLKSEQLGASGLLNIASLGAVLVTLLLLLKRGR